MGEGEGQREGGYPFFCFHQLPDPRAPGKTAHPPSYFWPNGMGGTQPSGLYVIPEKSEIRRKYRNNDRLKATEVTSMFAL